jgi:hypothetical protein
MVIRRMEEGRRFAGRATGTAGRTPLLLTALAIIGVLWVGAEPARGQTVVTQVTVTLTFDGVAPHYLIQNRLETTVRSVAERLLVGRSLDQVTALQPKPDETIASVVERVALGYTVVDAAVQVSATTMVAIRLRSAGTVIREVAVAADLRTVHPRVQALVTALLQPGPVEAMGALLIGLPVIALDWAGPLVDQQIRETLEAALPGFTSSPRVHPGAQTSLDLLIVPKDSRVIRNIGVRFRSDSIPLVLLDQHGPQVASMADPLRGLPVAFVDVQRRALERFLNEELAVYAPTAQYGVVVAVRLDVAETLYVFVTADSQMYRARVEAQLNIGTQAPGPAVVARLGRLVSPQLEPFVEIRLVPTPLALTAAVGVRFEVSPAAFVGATYALTPQQTTLWTTVQFSRDVGVRGGWTFPTQVFEGAAVYRINEFLAWELIGTSRGEAWIRLVSNL